jgi:segregation and condensation protein A
MITDNTITNQTKYKVEIDYYQGPLDLLLQLIQHEELDITKLALAKVTNSFLEYVNQLPIFEIEEASSFLLVAAKLMQIKSEALLPRPPDQDPGEEDPGEDLIHQLILYKRYKELSQTLKVYDDAGLHTFIRRAPAPKIERKVDISDISLEDLVKAAEIVFTYEKNIESLDKVVRKPKVTIRQKIWQISNKLFAKKKSTFRELLGEDTSRVGVVVTFLALLELVKEFRINATQEELFGEIDIEREGTWEDIDEIDLGFSE